MIEILSVNTQMECETTAQLARQIWTQHYIPIIGEAQVEYMLDKYQSKEAIQNQIDTGSRYYLIDYDEQNAGYFSFTQHDDHLFLSKLYVLDSFRGIGLGKKSMAFIENEAHKSSCGKIRLTVNKHNHNSIKAYEKLGFKKIDSVVQDIGNGFVMDDYVLEKWIHKSEI